jgi:putative hydrolase of the HAD superfamily
MQVLMMDVDGVLVRGRPRDGLHYSTDLQAEAGVSHAELQQEFFKPYWQDIVTGRDELAPRLAAVLRKIAPRASAQALIDYWFENDSRIDQDVLAAMASFRRRDIRVFLATNQEHLRAAYLMETLGLKSHVDGILYSAELGHRKPNSDFYRLATQRVGAAPEQIVLVDDTLANVEGARKFGWKSAHWTGELGLDRVLAATSEY